MFLHATLQLDALQRCFTTHDAMRVLKAFPSKIEDVYQQTWSRIVRPDAPPQRKSLAIRTFAWVLNARQPLTMDQLRGLLATCPETYHYDSTMLMPMDTILTACRGLIVADRWSGLIRLVHYTAKEPLINLLLPTLPIPHSLLTGICITRLADCGFQAPGIAFNFELKEALRADTVLDYAYHAWAFHANQSVHDDPTSARLVSSFITGCTTYPAMVSDRAKVSLYGVELLEPLHIIAFYNLPVSLAGPAAARDPNVQTSSRRMTPMHLACDQGHLNVAKDLLSFPEILVNRQDKFGASPLFTSTSKGHENLVALLLSRPDIDVNAKEGLYGATALIEASRQGQTAIVKHFLAHPEVNPNLTDDWNSTALLTALRFGHVTVGELLPGVSGISVNAVDSTGTTAIALAAEHGHTELVRMILNVPGVDICAQGTRRGRTPMSIAEARGHHAIVQLLLDFARAAN